MIDIRKLKELVRLMVANDLTELDLRDSEEQVTLRRHGLNSMPQMVAAASSTVPVPQVGAAPAAESAAAVAVEGQADIVSPMVGTFYSAPDPDSPVFVKVGDHVDPDTVVCVIEAMKIFNEIKAESSGIIAKVLVKNAEAIEFGQPLFTVKPD